MLTIGLTVCILDVMGLNVNCCHTFMLRLTSSHHGIKLTILEESRITGARAKRQVLRFKIQQSKESGRPDLGMEGGVEGSNAKGVPFA